MAQQVRNENRKIVYILYVNDIDDLNLIAVFEAVWRHRQISRAAAELGVAQPTVSNALRRLRATMDDVLFVRSGQTMLPTPLAERLGPYWCEAVASIRRGSAEKSGFDPARDRRRFSLVMTDIAEAVILPLLLDVCGTIAPSVSFRTTQLDIENTQAALRSGEVDLAIGYLPSLSSGVKQLHLFDSNYVVIARESHPAIKGGKLTRAAFLGCRYAIAEATGTGHVVVERALKRLGLADRVGAVVPHFLALPMIVAASHLLATVPLPLARLMRNAAAPIAIYEHPLKLPKLQIRQFWHERFDADPGVRWLRRTLHSVPQKADVLKPV